MDLCSRCIQFCVVLLLLSAGLVPEADAQSQKDRHRIRVTPEGDACLYQIQGQDNQDLFVVSPGGLVTIQARGGLWVDARVEDDPRGVPGTRNRRMLALRTQAPRDTLIARSSMGRSTEHRVRIQCCTSRVRGRACPRWTDAQPYKTESGRLNEGASGFIRGSSPDVRGPSAPSSEINGPSDPPPPGGPVMRVEEE